MSSILINPFQFAAPAAVSPAFNTGITNITYSSDNRRITAASNAQRIVTIGTAQTSGKHYCEFIHDTTGGNGVLLGISDFASSSQYPGQSPQSVGISSGTTENYISMTSATNHWAGGFADAGALVTGDRIGMAADLTGKKLWIHARGTWLRSGNPATGANPKVSGWTTANPLFFCCRPYFVTNTIEIPTSFLYTPAGFSVWPSA